MKYKLIRMSMIPKMIFMACPSIRSSRHIAIVEKMMKAAKMGSRRFHVTNFRYFIMTTVADVSERSPDRVTDSPYEGIRKGSAVMMNIPNPKPIVRCTKLAPIDRRNMYMIFSTK